MKRLFWFLGIRQLGLPNKKERRWSYGLRTCFIVFTITATGGIGQRVWNGYDGCDTDTIWVGSWCYRSIDSLHERQVTRQRKHNLLSALLCRLIRLYQIMAPSIIRKACRFQPTCSEYALQVFNAEGIRRGFPKVLRRLRRCRPPNGGIDQP